MDALETKASAFGPRETMDRLIAAITGKGMTVFARIDHAAGAARAGLVLRPTELVIFGNARAGTPLMQESQVSGLDLPLKALVWQDAANATWLSYSEPHVLVARYGLSEAAAHVAHAMAAALTVLAKAATELTAP
ncbi:MAG: DUF302 domain-containing protein [Polyangiaceae bacterium]